MYLADVLRDLSRYARGRKNRWEVSLTPNNGQTVWFSREQAVELHEALGAMLYGDLIQLKQLECGCLEPTFAKP